MRTFYKQLHTFLFIISIFSVMFLTSCSPTNRTATTQKLERHNFVLGTIAKISLYDHQSEEILDAAFEKLAELENILSINKTNTLIDEINENAGIRPVKVDTATFDLIKKGIYYSELTSGAFDITIGPLVKLWNIGFSNARVPSQIEINNAVPLVDYSLITLNEQAQTVYLEKKGMLLDLGSIGKGYAADEVANLLSRKGVENALINLGGNIYAMGENPTGRPWNIGIQNPFSSRGGTVGTISITNQSLVTSGIYERYITAKDGTTYHHILNPSTGYPFNNEIAGVSIISDTSTDGDALSTATFALGIEEGLSFIENMEGIDAVFITTDQKIYLTSGIKDQFTLTNSDFEICN